MIPVSPLVIGSHGAAFPAFGRRALAQRRQDHAHVRHRRGKRVPAPALARDGRKTCLSGLRLRDLLRVPAACRPAAMALQGLPPRFLDHLGHVFAWHKLPLQTYLLAVAGFCNEVKGIVSRRRASVMLYER